MPRFIINSEDTTNKRMKPMRRSLCPPTPEPVFKVPYFPAPRPQVTIKPAKRNRRFERGTPRRIPPETVPQISALAAFKIGDSEFVMGTAEDQTSFVTYSCAFCQEPIEPSELFEHSERVHGVKMTQRRRTPEARAETQVTEQTSQKTESNTATQEKVQMTETEQKRQVIQAVDRKPATETIKTSQSSARSCAFPKALITGETQKFVHIIAQTKLINQSLNCSA